MLNDVPDDPADRERCFRLQEGQDDIVRVVWERDVRVTGEMAKQAIAAVDDLNGDRPRRLSGSPATSSTRSDVCPIHVLWRQRLRRPVTSG